MKPKQSHVRLINYSKMLFGVVPSKNGNRRPRESGLFMIRLFIVAVSLSCPLPLVLVVLPCRERTSSLLSEKFMYHVLSSRPGVYAGTSNLIASISDPYILTLRFILVC